VTSIESSTVQLVDFEQIDCLLDAAGRDGVNEILAAFWKSTDDLSERLGTQIAGRDLIEAARTSHAVKGSAANVGAQLLASVAKDVENCCKSGDADGALAALQRLLFVYRDTRAALTDRVAAFG
jgi:HPt (histidine-containing phosphotransfer) domain-containing protein